MYFNGKSLELRPFNYQIISLLIISNYSKTNGARNEILFAFRLTGLRLKFKGKMFEHNFPDFFVYLFVFQIVFPINYSP